MQSALGQPLRAEVEVTSVGRDEAGSLAVRLAPQSAFRQANLEFNPALSALRFDLERRGDNAYVVRITSLQPINEPYLDLLLELTWATGRVLREYTVLLDPPALRATPEVIAPVAPPAGAPQPPVAAPSPGAVAPAPAASAPAAPAQPPREARTAAAPAASAPGGTYTVQRGDTLSKIAAQTKPAEVSLEQMLVALFRANPNAFVGQNMNRMLAGRTLIIPSASDALAVSTAEARQEVAAQSADFAQYRSRLAQTAVAMAPATTGAPPAAAGQGRVTTRVEDKAAPPKAGDQLKIARVEPPAGAAAGKAAADEAVAKQRALKEQEERAAELKKANEQLKKALELQSKAGAALQQQAEAKKEPEKAAPAAPTAAPAAAADASKAVAPAEPPKPVAEAPKAEAPKADAPKAEPAKAEAPAPAPAPAPQADVARTEPKKAEPPKAAAPAQPEPGFFDFLKDSTTVGLLALVVALFGGLIGLNIYRKRKLDKGDEQVAGEGLRANSLFGQTGGQSVDTG
ncbi:MAG: LysM peptidoglycan-binding domain-containing protein, partial [Burkholderiaceae bacterium]|nr:LysM peptidoglycan-binding domain-containing protein [Burkholderiaceae bacterium]